MSLQHIPDNFSCYVKSIKRCKQGNCEYLNECKQPGGMDQSEYELSVIHRMHDYEYSYNDKKYLKQGVIRRYHRNIDEYLNNPARLPATPKELEEWYAHEEIEMPSPATHRGKFSVW